MIVTWRNSSTVTDQLTESLSAFIFVNFDLGWLNLLNVQLCLCRGTGGGQDPRWWGMRDTIEHAPLSPPEWFCFEMGSDESRFKVPLIVRDSHRTLSTSPTFEEKREPNGTRTEVLPLTSLPPYHAQGWTVWHCELCCHLADHIRLAQGCLVLVFVSFWGTEVNGDKLFCLMK